MVFVISGLGGLPSRFGAECAGVEFYQPLSPVAHAIATDIRDVPRPIVYANFAGMGPLDPSGIQVAAGRPVRGQNADDVMVFRDELPIKAIESALRASNVLLLNKEARLWPKYVGVNTMTQPRYEYLRSHAAEHGFTLINRHFIRGNFSETVEVWMKPYASVTVTLKYASYDTWLDQTTSMSIAHPTVKHFEAFRLIVDVYVANPQLTEFAPPFSVRLLNEAGRESARTSVTQFGLNHLCFDFSGNAGVYSLVSEKTFSTPSDARQFFAQYESTALEKGSCKEETQP